MLFGKEVLVFDLPENEAPIRYLAECDVEKPDFSKFYGEDKLRSLKLNLPNLSQTQVARHYTNMSSRNFGNDNGPYLLGSCTMKYNPKSHEKFASLPGFLGTHPLQPDTTVQGNLELLYDLEKQLCDVCGMDAFTFQPAAGAHGELTGVMLIKAYHEDHGNPERNIMLIPDSAHGTNPASAAMAGFKVVEVGSQKNGQVDLEDLKAKVEKHKDQLAGLMLTNPNTLGIFEENVDEMTTAVHDAGGLIYYDGANINAILMQVRPGDMGFDVVHLNVHKSFSTPHGGGGPGAGPVGVKECLVPYLPKPRVMKQDEEFKLEYNLPKSIGKVRAFAGSFTVLLKTYCYILANGAEGLKNVSEGAVANANYIFRRVRDKFKVPYDAPFMHEFVISGDWQKEKGCSTMDMAKRMIDYGMHPPTVYFPLIVHEAMMFEPTETETQENLDMVADTLLAIAKEVDENPELVQSAPHNTPVGRPDEVKAAREPILKYPEE
ncbi:MAG: aminomethyl-transferring glycine dehydrogenase subunit GcvPB [Eubacteriales bacterium]|nr:aminomethyl-transferring glycine dehydrogenase subunit GcvPB [Eubacteriales bacterium]